jgi:hypothetical protein
MANVKKGTKIPIIPAQLSVWMGATKNRKSSSSKGRRWKCIWPAPATDSRTEGYLRNKTVLLYERGRRTFVFLSN